MDGPQSSHPIDPPKLARFLTLYPKWRMLNICFEVDYPLRGPDAQTAVFSRGNLIHTRAVDVIRRVSPGRFDNHEECAHAKAE